MKTLLPTASRERLEELLAYLGDRAGDFMKCVDIESPWCWEYANHVLSGINKPRTPDMEEHHIIPACFYGRRDASATRGNTTTVTHVGHMYAHYCITMCSRDNIHDSMARTFKSLHRKCMNMIDCCDDYEASLVRSIDPGTVKLLNPKNGNLNIRLDDELRTVVDYLKLLPGGVTKWLHDRLHEVEIDNELLQKLSVYTNHTSHT